MSKPKIGVIVGSTRATRFRRQAGGMDRQHSKGARRFRRRNRRPARLSDAVLRRSRFVALGALEERGGAALAEEGRRVRRLHRDRGRIQPRSDGGAEERARLRLHEWNRKPVTFVGYGGVGGARAIEQLRLHAVELQMAPSRMPCTSPGATSSQIMQQGKKLEEFEHLNQAADDRARRARLVGEGAEDGTRGRGQGRSRPRHKPASILPRMANGVAKPPRFRCGGFRPTSADLGPDAAVDARQARGDDLVDAAAVEIDHLEAPALRVDAFAGRRQAVEMRQDDSRRRSRSRGSPAGRCRAARPSRRPACSRRAAMNRPRA